MTGSGGLVTNGTPLKRNIMKKTVRNPWSFVQPPYDARSSCFINAGTEQGVGKKQPVGTEKQSNKPAIPQKSHAQDPKYYL